MGASRKRANACLIKSSIPTLGNHTESCYHSIQLDGQRHVSTAIGLTSCLHLHGWMIHNYYRYSLLDVDGESGFLTLLTEEGQTKEDAALSRATDEPDETEFDAVNLSLPPSPRISFQYGQFT